jgi:hypothetical protein
MAGAHISGTSKRMASKHPLPIMLQAGVRMQPAVSSHDRISKPTQTQQPPSMHLQTHLQATSQSAL